MISALPPLSVALPIELPPVAHPDDVSSGPQTEKLTVPAGVPPVELPVTVTESDVAAPAGSSRPPASRSCCCRPA